MKISQMEYFSCVCQCGSITKAAKELHISQPSVTTAVHELEKELGVNLFLRRNNKIQLTEEGRFVQERIDGILKSMDTLNRDLNDFVGQKNHIRLGVPLQIGSFLLPLLFDVDGIWYAITVAEVFATIISVIFLFAKRKKYQYM